MIAPVLRLGRRRDYKEEEEEKEEKQEE